MSKAILSRRAFMRMVAAVAASCAFAWKVDGLKVEAKEDAPDICVDLAEPGEDETVFHVGGPFADGPGYFIEPVTVHWENMKDGDTWGLPDDYED